MLPLTWNSCRCDYFCFSFSYFLIVVSDLSPDISLVLYWNLIVPKCEILLGWELIHLLHRKVTSVIFFHDSFKENVCVYVYDFETGLLDTKCVEIWNKINIIKCFLRFDYGSFLWLGHAAKIWGWQYLLELVKSLEIILLIHHHNTSHYELRK